MLDDSVSNSVGVAGDNRVSPLVLSNEYLGSASKPELSCGSCEAMAEMVKSVGDSVVEVPSSIEGSPDDTLDQFESVSVGTLKSVYCHVSNTSCSIWGLQPGTGAGSEGAGVGNRCTPCGGCSDVQALIDVVRLFEGLLPCLRETL